MSNQQGNNDAVTFAFTKHVPAGKQPCTMCCSEQMGLQVMPGYFRDFDVDVGPGQFGVCCDCAGTGIELQLSDDTRQQIHNYRFQRYQLALTAETLKREILFNHTLLACATSPQPHLWLKEAQTLLTDPTTSWTETNFLKLANVVQICDVILRRPNEDCLLGAIVCLRDELLASQRTNTPITEQETGPWSVFVQNVLAACQRLRQIIVKPDDPDANHFVQEMQTQLQKLEDEQKHISQLLHQQYLYEEMMLLLLVRYYWIITGQPNGCYAERLMPVLNEILTLPMRRQISDQELAEFTPEETPEELAGLTPRLLAELHNQTKCFGTLGSDMVRQLSLRDPEIHVCVSAKANRTIISIIGPGGITEEGAHTFILKSGFVIWDNRVTVSQIKQFIALVDAVASKQGLINEETGERITRVTGRQDTKFKVAKVFAKQGSAMPVLPGSPDAATLLESFDHPEELMIHQDPFGMESIIHKRDLLYLQKRATTAQELLRRHGITSLEQITDLPLQRVLELREELEQELERVNSH